jgi:hypothetical protein
MIDPPRTASWLLLAALPTSDGDAIAGDLCEEFQEHIVPARGLRFARWWYCWQVARSLAPLFFRSWQRASVTRAAAAIVAAGAMAALPASALLLVRAFVLSQVPLKTTSELSAAFAVVLAGVIVATMGMGLAVAIRTLQRR